MPVDRSSIERMNNLNGRLLKGLQLNPAFMKRVRPCLFITLVAFSFNACNVTNNLYVNNPVPHGKGNGDVYLGLGTGIEPKIDSISADGGINSSGGTSMAPVLSFGGQFGVSKQMDVRAAIHLPYVIGGFGLRVGAQYSFFDASSRFNAAFGTDIAFNLAKDSITLFGSTSSLDTKSKGAITGDFFLPLSVKIDGNFSIILTPRYSSNVFFILKNGNSDKINHVQLYYPALTLGIRVADFYMESTAVYYHNSFYPHLGVLWVFPSGSEDE